MTTPGTSPMEDRRAQGTGATGLMGRQRRRDDRRRLLVSQALSALRGGVSGGLSRPHPIEAARNMLERRRNP